MCRFSGTNNSDCHSQCSTRKLKVIHEAKLIQRFLLKISQVEKNIYPRYPKQVICLLFIEKYPPVRRSEREAETISPGAADASRMMTQKVTACDDPELHPSHS
ncbi:hypothetical protein AVEN_1177-1 [Araneus ventricosus]|uniref:Uncharacterized protein n=1 Tax=Araneus ventricosus TaxID=182803 RepID=A0A4Y2EFF4_ARAVE|nr:hypothetical protein AVEN_1177-1 [Araneus ventricosus]